MKKGDRVVITKSYNWVKEGMTGTVYCSAGYSIDVVWDNANGKGHFGSSKNIGETGHFYVDRDNLELISSKLIFNYLIL